MWRLIKAFKRIEIRRLRNLHTRGQSLNWKGIFFSVFHLPCRPNLDFFQILIFCFFTTNRTLLLNLESSFYIINQDRIKGFKEAFYDSKEVKNQFFPNYDLNKESSSVFRKVGEKERFWNSVTRLLFSFQFSWGLAAAAGLVA